MSSHLILSLANNLASITSFGKWVNGPLHFTDSHPMWGQDTSITLQESAHGGWDLRTLLNNFPAAHRYMVSSPHQDAANFNHLFNPYTHNPDAYNPSAFFPFEINSAATVAYTDLLPDVFLGNFTPSNYSIWKRCFVCVWNKLYEKGISYTEGTCSLLLRTWVGIQMSCSFQIHVNSFFSDTSH